MKAARLAGLAIVTVLFLIALLIKAPFQFAQSVVPNDAYLWVATIGSLVKLDATDGSTEAQPAEAQDQLRLAIDKKREILWSYSRGTLGAFNSAGQLLHKSAVPPPASATTNLALAVDSTTGHVWLGIQKRLHEFNSQGQLVKSIDLAAQLQDLSFDPDSGHLWVATQPGIGSRSFLI